MPSQYFWLKVHHTPACGDVNANKTLLLRFTAKTLNMGRIFSKLEELCQRDPMRSDNGDGDFHYRTFAIDLDLIGMKHAAQIKITALHVLTSCLTNLQILRLFGTFFGGDAGRDAAAAQVPFSLSLLDIALELNDTLSLTCGCLINENFLNECRKLFSNKLVIKLKLLRPQGVSNYSFDLLLKKHTSRK